MSALSVHGLSVDLSGSRVLDDVTFQVEAGEVVALLGPSGSGKSTLLRAIAGLVPSSGSISLAGIDLGPLPTHRRGIGLMFQSHALFPHLSVEQNVLFGLREIGVGAAEAEQRATELLDLVGLDSFADRSVDALSGGEAQRVALARALAPRPQLLMLDEPLGSLDRRLRDELTEELAALLRQTRTTALYVTHDQDEAAAVADRLLILDGGKLVASGEPERLWQRPPTPWVARFLGHRNVSDDAMIPIGAVRVGGPGGLPATVRSCRFIDGDWRVRLVLTSPIAGMTELHGLADRLHEPGANTSAAVDDRSIIQFPSLPD